MHASPSRRHCQLLAAPGFFLSVGWDYPFGLEKMNREWFFGLQRLTYSYDDWPRPPGRWEGRQTMIMGVWPSSHFCVGRVRSSQQTERRVGRAVTYTHTNWERGITYWSYILLAHTLFGRYAGPLIYGTDGRSILAQPACSATTALFCFFCAT